MPFYVKCRKCDERIAVGSKPTGATNISNVRTSGSVNISGGAIGFGPGGAIAFGPGGSIGFGGPRTSRFVCGECGHAADYEADDIKEE